MDAELISAAAEALEIEGVFLRKSGIRCKEDFVPQFVEDELALVPQYRAGPTGAFHVVTATQGETGNSVKTVMFYFAVGVRLIDARSQEADQSAAELGHEAVYVEMDAEFSAQYRLAGSGDEHDLRPALDEFGRHNVGYHVWPYWREYVQSTCARLGIPPIPIPMYRIHQGEEGNPAASEG
jgi:hypothetical protein